MGVQRGIWDNVGPMENSGSTMISVGSLFFGRHRNLRLATQEPKKLV